MCFSALQNGRTKLSIRTALFTLTCAFALVFLFANPASALAGEGIADDAAQLQAADTNIASGEIGECTWTIDEAGKLTLAPKEGDAGAVDFYNPISPGKVSSEDGRAPWYPFAESIRSAEVQGTVSVTGNSCRMFENCRNLVAVDLAGLETSQLTSFDYMFTDCHNLASVDLSKLDASSVKYVNNMFLCCYKLASVELPDFRGARLEGMNAMFQQCRSLVSIDLSDIDTSNVQTATNFAFGCTALQKVIVGDNWDLPRQMNVGIAAFFNTVFYGCNSLVGANGTSFAEAGVRDASYARIDTPETPGYFWPVENAGEGGSEGDNPSGDNPGGDNPSGDDLSGGSTGDDPSGDNPGGDNPSGDDPSGDNPGSGDNPSGENPSGSGESGPGSTAGGDSGSDGSGSSGGTTTKPTQVKRASITKASVKLSATTFAYNGKARTPAVTVKLGKKTLRKGRDFTVAYSKGRKEIGQYKVTVTGKGSYKSKVTKTFSIVPKAPMLKTLTAHKNSNGSSGFIATWQRVGNTSIGYQIRWSNVKTFKQASRFTLKGSTTYAKKGKAAIRVRTTAWLGKPAYVQVRAFKVVGGKTYYSSWSPTKSVKLKK